MSSLSPGSGGLVSADFRIKRNDTLPSLLVSLSERDPDSADARARRPLNLELVDTATLMARTRDAKTRISGECVIISADPSDPIWPGYPDLTPYPYQVRYDWADGDTARAAIYLAEIELVFVGGGVQTVPAQGCFTVIIEEDQG